MVFFAILCCFALFFRVCVGMWMIHCILWGASCLPLAPPPPLPVLAFFLFFGFRKKSIAIHK